MRHFTSIFLLLVKRVVGSISRFICRRGSRTGGAHGRYGEDDWSFGVCREKMTTVRKLVNSLEHVAKELRCLLQFLAALREHNVQGMGGALWGFKLFIHSFI